jgi:hypothetical protein
MMSAKCWWREPENQKARKPESEGARERGSENPVSSVQHRGSRFVLCFVLLILTFSGLVSAANAQQLIDKIKIEAHDAEGDPDNQYGIRLIGITVEGELTERDDDILGTVSIGGVQIARGSLLDGGHELYATEGTDIVSSGAVGDMIEANRDGEFVFTFVFPANAVGNVDATLDLLFGNEAGDLDGIGVDAYDADIRAGTDRQRDYQFAVQLPNFTEGDVDDRVYRNGDTIDFELECETPAAGPVLSTGEEIEVLTIFPDFSNVDSAFAGGNSIDPTTGGSLVPLGRVANDTTHNPALRRYGRYNLAAWDPNNTNPDALDLYDLVLDVDRAMRDGRVIIEERGGDYDVSYTISDGNDNEPGRKRAFVHGIDYPCVLNIYDMPTIFAKAGLAFPGALNIATWQTGRDMGDPSFVLHLQPGWNLISLPVDPGVPGYELLSILRPIEKLYKSVWAYDADLKDWKRYTVGVPDVLNDLRTMEPKKGYWINMIDEATLTVTGMRITDMTIPLSQGWNLVGYSSLKPQPAEDALVSIADERVSIWTYDSKEGNWLKYAIGAPDPLNSLGQLEPGKGYWIYIESGCYWTIPDTGY